MEPEHDEDTFEMPEDNLEAVTEEQAEFVAYLQEGALIDILRRNQSGGS